MQRAGLNTVRLPVGWWYFAPKFAVSPQPYILPDEDLYDRHHPITDVIGWAKCVSPHFAPLLRPSVSFFGCKERRSASRFLHVFCFCFLLPCFFPPLTFESPFLVLFCFYFFSIIVLFALYSFLLCFFFLVPHHRETEITQ